MDSVRTGTKQDEMTTMQDPSPSEPPFGQLRAQMMLGSEDGDGVVFSTVLSYCLLILGGPIATFFASKSLLFSGLLGWDPDSNWTSVASAVLAVVFLHVALGLFIAKAFFGTSDQAKVKIGKKD